MTIKSVAQFHIYLPSSLSQYQIQQTLLMNQKNSTEFLIKKNQIDSSSHDKLCCQKFKLFSKNQEFVVEIEYFNNGINKYIEASTSHTEGKIGIKEIDKANGLDNLKLPSLGSDYLHIAFFFHFLFPQGKILQPNEKSIAIYS